MKQKEEREYFSLTLRFNKQTLITIGTWILAIAIVFGVLGLLANAWENIFNIKYDKGYDKGYSDGYNTATNDLFFTIQDQIVKYGSIGISDNFGNKMELYRNVWAEDNSPFLSNGTKVKP